MIMMMRGGSGAHPPLFRAEWGDLLPSLSTVSDSSGRGYGYMQEKRQLFLRSYQFSRKKSSVEKVRCCAVRVRRLIWIRLRAARRLPRLLWRKLRRCVSSSSWWHVAASYGHGRSCRRSRFRRLP